MILLKYSALLTTTMTCLAGCNGGISTAPTLLVSQADFDNVTDAIFNSPDFERRGSGLEGGPSEIECSAVYDPDKELFFDFSQWSTFLEARDRFNGHGKGGNQGVYWHETWENEDRFIVVDAAAMKDGTVRVTYREILRQH